MNLEPTPEISLTIPSKQNDVICVHGPRDRPLTKLPQLKRITSTDPFDYWRFITSYWKHVDEDGPFINVEQDIIAEQKHIDELFACPEPYCGYGFYTWYDRDIYFDGDNELYYLPRKPEKVFTYLCGPESDNTHSQSGGIGLCKFGGQLTAHLKKMPFFCLDWSVLWAMQEMGTEWHIHKPPVEHQRDPNYYQGGRSKMYSLWEDSPMGPATFHPSGRIIAVKNVQRNSVDIGRK